jgi:hypothetical protein
MIFTSLFGVALAVATASAPLDDSVAASRLTAQQQKAATAALVRSATECIVRAVMADPRYGAEATVALDDLIVASMPTCVTPVRAMIAAYDRFYGEGMGEAFFMGPYLDVLPKAVSEGAANEPE